MKFKDLVYLKHNNIEFITQIADLEIKQIT